jgi:NaMN:DMB phosphoribosyltransferase
MKMNYEETQDAYEQKIRYGVAVNAALTQLQMDDISPEHTENYNEKLKTLVDRYKDAIDYVWEKRLEKKVKKEEILLDI